MLFFIIIINYNNTTIILLSADFQISADFHIYYYLFHICRFSAPNNCFMLVTRYFVNVVLPAPHLCIIKPMNISIIRLTLNRLSKINYMIKIN